MINEDMIDHCIIHNLSNCEIKAKKIRPDKLLDGLIAQLAEHCTGVTEVMGFNHI